MGGNGLDGRKATWHTIKYSIHFPFLSPVSHLLIFKKQPGSLLNLRRPTSHKHSSHCTVVNQLCDRIKLAENTNGVIVPPLKLQLSHPQIWHLCNIFKIKIICGLQKYGLRSVIGFPWAEGLLTERNILTCSLPQEPDMPSKYHSCGSPAWAPGISLLEPRGKSVYTCFNKSIHFKGIWRERWESCGPEAEILPLMEKLQEI